MTKKFIQAAACTGVTTLTPATASTATIDCSLGNLWLITLPTSGTAVTMATPTNPTAGQCIQVVFTQGSSVVTAITWPANTVIKWVGGNKTITATVNAITMVSMVYTGSIWYASLGGALA